MLPNVVGVTQTGPYRLRLRFDDGAEGDIDLKETLSFVGVFEPLRDPAYFSQVRVDPEAGTASGRTERISIRSYFTPGSPAFPLRSTFRQRRLADSWAAPARRATACTGTERRSVFRTAALGGRARIGWFDRYRSTSSARAVTPW